MTTPWEHQQEVTFIDWTNYYLSKYNKETYADLDDLMEKDGILHLIETIFSKPIFKNKAATSPFIRLENYNKALTILGQPFGVVALNIVFNKDRKMTVSLLWHIIQKYNLSKFSNEMSDTQFCVFEYNDPVEPIQYWENDVDSLENSSADDTDSIPENGITLNKAVSDWITNTPENKEITLDDMLYCRGDKDERLIAFSKFVGLFAELPITVERLTEKLETPTLKQIVEDYCSLQEALHKELGVPLMSIIFSNEVDPEEEANPNKLFNLNEQSFTAYLCAVRDCQFKKRQTELGEEDIPPALPEYEIEEAETEKDLLNEVDRKLTSSNININTNNNENNEKSIFVNFEEFVNFLEPELRPLAYKLKNQYDIRITKINEYLSLLTLQEEERRNRDMQRRARMKLRLELQKQKIESKRKQLLLEYDMKQRERKNKMEYIKRKEELEQIQKKMRVGKPLLNPSKETEIKKYTKYKESRPLTSKYDIVESSTEHKRTRRPKKVEREHYTKTTTTTHRHHHNFSSSSKHNSGSKYCSDSESYSDSHTDSGSEMVQEEREVKIMKMGAKCRNCGNKCKSVIREDEYEDEKEFHDILNHNIPYIKSECSNCNESVKLKVRHIETTTITTSNDTTSTSVSKNKSKSKNKLKDKNKEKNKEKGLKRFKGLTVTIFGCRDLASKHFLGRSANPFVMVSFDGKQKKTPVKHETLSPKFNCSLVFDFDKPLILDTVIHISVRDDNGNKYLGSKEFKMKEIMSLTSQGSEKYKGLYELSNSKGALIGLGFQFKE